MKHCKECGKTEDQVWKWIMTQVETWTDLWDVDIKKLTEEQTYEVILEKYRWQLLEYSSKEIKSFDKEIWKFLVNKEYPKEIRQAVWFFYMKLHVLEYSIK